MGNKQILKVGVGLTIVVLLVVFVASFSMVIRRLFGFADSAEHEDTPFVPGEPLPVNFDPRALIARLTEVHEEWLLDASPRCGAYRRLMELTDNEFILVCNEYAKIIGDSLRSNMDSTFQSGCSVSGVKWDKRVRNRMDELNIIG